MFGLLLLSFSLIIPDDSGATSLLCWGWFLGCLLNMFFSPSSVDASALAVSHCVLLMSILWAASEWLQVKLIIITPYWWINSIHRCFCQNVLRAWPCRRKFVKLLALWSHHRILVNHNFSEAQRKHFVNSKASIKWQASVRILFYIYGCLF